MLALYPDEQDWVHQSIVDTLGDREPVCHNSNSSSNQLASNLILKTFEDFDDLVGVLACFYEGLRLFRKLRESCDRRDS